MFLLLLERNERSEFLFFVSLALLFLGEWKISRKIGRTLSQMNGDEEINESCAVVFNGCSRFLFLLLY